jgi:hypothetical protein
MKKRKFSAGGGVPVTAGMYDAAPAQYPFPTSSTDSGITSNTNVTVNDKEVASEEQQAMRRGGKVKAKRTRGDGIAQRGKTRGKFV